MTVSVEAESSCSNDPETLRDTRITDVRSLVSPGTLRAELPVSQQAAAAVARGRRETVAVLNGEDDRLLVVVGPCSVHDPDAALDYARRLSALAAQLGDRLHIVMRVYFEKPRTTLGWKGLINDPGLDGSYDVNAGVRATRSLLLRILELGLPIGCEFLDPVIPQYLADAVSWGSIGARTAQSQVHRQLASGLSMPIGIKNATHGGVQDAVDAVGTASGSHVFTGVTAEGVAAIMTTAGNEDCHVILRGGSDTTNYDAASVRNALALLEKAGLPGRVCVDASHGNSGKDHNRQPAVAADIAEQIAAGQDGIIGLMLESFLLAGRQEIEPGRAGKLDYGRSITDGCLSWSDTVPVLTGLAEAVTKRRAARDAALS